MIPHFTGKRYRGAVGHRPCAVCGRNLGVSDQIIGRRATYVVPVCEKHMNGKTLRPFATVLDTTQRGKRFALKGAA